MAVPCIISLRMFEQIDFKLYKSVSLFIFKYIYIYQTDNKKKNDFKN